MDIRVFDIESSVNKDGEVWQLRIARCRGEFPRLAYRASADDLPASVRGWLTDWAGSDSAAVTQSVLASAAMTTEDARKVAGTGEAGASS